MNNVDVKNSEKQFLDSQNSREVEVKFFGDRNTIIGVVTLLSYIRNAIQSNSHKEIKVEIGNNIANGKFDFLVNDSKIDDLIVKDKIEIN